MISYITPSSTWDIIDSTKLAEYTRCPRSFFFKYVLGWRGEEGEHNDLIFGQAWHLAMRHLAIHGYDVEHQVTAYRLFEEKYREHFISETDLQFYPKVPGAVMFYIPAYCNKYKDDHERYKTIYTEIGGTVSIGHDRIMHFKMDSVRQNLDTGKFMSRDYKTGKSNSRAWRDKFKLSIQMGCYDHALRCLYGPDDVEGIEVDGAFFTKGALDVLSGEKKAKANWEEPFVRVPIDRKPEMSNVWLWNVNNWIESLNEDMYILQNMDDGDVEMDNMPCFRQNPESCTDYWGCPWMELCLNWANPLKFAHTPPIGYMVEYWDPSKEDLDVTVELALPSTVL